MQVGCIVLAQGIFMYMKFMSAQPVILIIMFLVVIGVCPVPQAI